MGSALKKVLVLVWVVILGLTLTGDAFANKSIHLVAWGTNCVSSDPPGSSLDYVDPQNPNGAVDVGSLEAWRNFWNQLECKIVNGYPGYQAYVQTEVINLTKEPVKISGVKVSGDWDGVLVSVTDQNGQDLLNRVIDKNSRMKVRVTTRIKDDAEQADVYRFKVQLLFNQTENQNPSDPSDHQE